MDYAVTGVKQVQFNALQSDGLVGIDEQCHVTATVTALLDEFDQVLQQSVFVATVFSEQASMTLRFTHEYENLEPTFAVIAHGRH